MIPTLLAATGDREASPIGLVVVLCLVVALVLLIRSMNRHLRRVPPTFADPDDDRAPRQDATRPAASDPDGPPGGPGIAG